MSIYGTCKTCGSETRDYCCVDCLAAENARLRELVKRIVDSWKAYEANPAYALIDEFDAALAEAAAFLAPADGESGVSP